MCVKMCIVRIILLVNCTLWQDLCVQLILYAQTCVYSSKTHKSFESLLTN